MTRLRPLLASLSLLLCALLLGPVTAGAQVPGADETLQELRSESMGIVKGCDYAKYIALADNIIENWDQFGEYLDGWEPDRDFSAPFTDYLAMLLQAGESKASQEAAEAETKGLLYTLEDVCNTSVQAQEINRMYDIVQSGSLNIGSAIDWLMEESEVEIKLDEGEPTLTGDFENVYSGLVPATGRQDDTLYAAIGETLEGTMRASDDMFGALDTIQAELEQAKKDLVLVAEEDTTDSGGQWMCPDGYPDPDEAEDVKYNDEGMPICGPASPERSTQVTARIELLKTQIRAIEMSAMARDLELGSVGLMADNHKRRQRDFTNAQVAKGH